LYSTYEGTYYFHLQDRRARQASKESSILCLLGLLLVPEEGRSVFLLNIGKLVPECIAKLPRR
jgi:hypothetical protein